MIKFMIWRALLVVQIQSDPMWKSELMFYSANVSVNGQTNELGNTKYEFLIAAGKQWTHKKACVKSEWCS
jgi:hypothetical protein